MADLEFNTASGQTVDRELLIAYLNTGTTSAPVWSTMVLVPVLSSLPASEAASVVVSETVSVSEASALPPKRLAVSTDTVSTPAKIF